MPQAPYISLDGKVRRKVGPLLYNNADAFRSVKMEEHEARVDVDYRDAILKRLVTHFRNAERLPIRQDESELLTFELLHRLCRHVIVEGYGQ